MPRSKRGSSLRPWRLIVGAAIIAALATCAAPHADADHQRRTCILFEDDSFMCGTVDPLGGWLDRTQPYIVGCIPLGICDSPDGMRDESLDGDYIAASTGK